MPEAASNLDEGVAKNIQDRLEAIEGVLEDAGFKLAPKKKIGIIAATWGSPNKAVRVTTKVVVAAAAGAAVYGGYRGYKAYKAKKAAAAQPQVTTL